MDAKLGPTIYDIAEKANVSISTVSRVFNKSTSVSKKTRKKVENAIEELNYIPNAIARSLANKSSNTIGLIVSDISNPYFASVIDGIESILGTEGYSAILCDTRYSLEREKKYLAQMLEKRVDGIIIFSVYQSDYSFIKTAKNIIPFVSIQSDFGETDTINTHDEKGAYDAVQHLIDLGHKNIAFMLYDYDSMTISNRFKGYINAHRTNDLPVNKNYIVKMKFQPNVGFDMTNYILDNFPEVTAIFAYNDKLAMSSYIAIQARGLKIPDTISIVGYDDTEIASCLTPKLTTVEQPIYDIGTNAAELLIKRIKERENTIPKLITLPTKLIIRESTRSV